MSTNPLVAPTRDSTTWYTGLGMVEDAAQITNGIQNNSWVDGTLGGVGASLDMLSLAIDPLGTLVAWGVSWLMEHVKPFKDALDWLAGSADQVAAHAATWS